MEWVYLECSIVDGLCRPNIENRTEVNRRCRLTKVFLPWGSHREIDRDRQLGRASVEMRGGEANKGAYRQPIAVSIPRALGKVKVEEMDRRWGEALAEILREFGI